MKKSLLISLLTFMSVSIYCQEPGINQSFPDSNAIWINGRYNPQSPTGDLTYTENYCLTAEDTVINETNYKKLRICEADYQGALRSDSIRVYFVPRDSTNEFLVYDFSAELGDTLYDVFFQESPDEPGFLMDIVFVEANLVSLEDYETVDYWELGGGAYYGTWIDNVGEYAGFLNPPGVLWESDYSFQRRLVCHSHSDSIWYTHYIVGFDPGPGACALNLSVGKGAVPIVEVHPNPVVEKLTCTFNPNFNFDRVRLLDIRGSSVEVSYTLSGGQLEMDMTTVPQGIYILDLRGGNQVVTKRVVKGM